jgi:hypothetical protein
MNNTLKRKEKDSQRKGFLLELQRLRNKLQFVIGTDAIPDYIFTSGHFTESASYQTIPTQYWETYAHSTYLNTGIL